MTAWYCLKSRDELFTADMLRDAGYPAYVPCERHSRRLGRKMRQVVRPIMPGYIFVACTEEAFSAVRAIGAANDFVRYLRPDGVYWPLRLPANALAPVLLAEACGEFDYTREPPPGLFSRGDEIRVKRGLWQGYVGKIVSVGKGRAVVSIKGAKLTLKADALELVA